MNELKIKLLALPKFSDYEIQLTQLFLKQKNKGKFQIEKPSTQSIKIATKEPSNTFIEVDVNTLLTIRNYLDNLNEIVKLFIDWVKYVQDKTKKDFGADDLIEQVIKQLPNDIDTLSQMKTKLDQAFLIDPSNEIAYTCVTLMAAICFKLQNILTSDNNEILIEEPEPETNAEIIPVCPNELNILYRLCVKYKELVLSDFEASLKKNYHTAYVYYFQNRNFIPNSLSRPEEIYQDVSDNTAIGIGKNGIENYYSQFIAANNLLLSFRGERNINDKAQELLDRIDSTRALLVRKSNPNKYVHHLQYLFTPHSFVIKQHKLMHQIETLACKIYNESYDNKLKY